MNIFQGNKILFIFQYASAALSLPQSFLEPILSFHCEL